MEKLFIAVIILFSSLFLLSGCGGGGSGSSVIEGSATMQYTSLRNANVKAVLKEDFVSGGDVQRATTLSSLSFKVEGCEISSTTLPVGSVDMTNGMYAFDFSVIFAKECNSLNSYITGVKTTTTTITSTSSGGDNPSTSNEVFRDSKPFSIEIKATSSYSDTGEGFGLAFVNAPAATISGEAQYVVLPLRLTNTNNSGSVVNKKVVASIASQNYISSTNTAPRFEGGETLYTDSNGYVEFKIYFPPNNSTSPRENSFNFISEDAFLTTTITQSNSATHNYSITNLGSLTNIDGSSQSVKFTFRVLNTTTSSGASFASVKFSQQNYDNNTFINNLPTTKSADSDGYVEFSVNIPQNYSGASRTFNFLATTNGISSNIITLTQAAPSVDTTNEMKYIIDEITNWGATTTNITGESQNIRAKFRVRDRITGDVVQNRVVRIERLAIYSTLYSSILNSSGVQVGSYEQNTSNDGMVEFLINLAQNSSGANREHRYSVEVIENNTVESFYSFLFTQQNL